MFAVIENLPDGVVGVTASGEVTGDDYRTVLLPRIDEARQGGKKVRLLYVIGEFKLKGSAVWADAKLGMEHFTSFERVAVVTDEDWIEKSIHAFGWIIPGEVKVFDDDDRDDAIAWLART